MGIWQDLVSQAGFAGGYGTLKRFVPTLRGWQTPEAWAVIISPAEWLPWNYRETLESMPGMNT